MFTQDKFQEVKVWLYMFLLLYPRRNPLPRGQGVWLYMFLLLYPQRNLPFPCEKEQNHNFHSVFFKALPCF